MRLACLLVVFAALVAGGCAKDEAPAAVETTPPLVRLRIIFPEGFTRRDMADRVAAVRRIAIDKRGVTPRLTRTGFLEASGAAVPPSFGRTGSSARSRASCSRRRTSSPS